MRSRERDRIMLMCTTTGGICGVFTFEVAETKVAQVVEFAHEDGIRCNYAMEKE